MVYRVELTQRALRDLRRLYRSLSQTGSSEALTWFRGLEQVVRRLDELPARGARTPEDDNLRQVFHGSKPDTYRIIYGVDDQSGTALVLHTRHRQRAAFKASDVWNATDMNGGFA